MKKNLLAFLFLAATLFAHSQTLVHYWNFNDNSSLTNLLTPNAALVAGGAITHIAGGISTIDFAGGTGQGFDVNNFNARNGDLSGTHLRFNDPIGGELVFALPTTGFQNVVVTFSTRRSGSGAGMQYWSYTTDGTNYTLFDSIAPSSAAPELKSFDFSAMPATDNNPNFKLKVAFAVGAGGLAGNNRFDNFTLDGAPLPVVALVHYWNFNDNSSETNLLTPNTALVPGGSITHLAGGTSIIDPAGGTGQGFDIDNFNARNGDLSGTHLRFNNPPGGELVFALPTTGFENVVVKFATRRSGSGASIQYWSYTTDGTNYTLLDSIFPSSAGPELKSFDFNNMPATDNNPNFKLKVSFAAGIGGLAGNNRFDNFTLDGEVIGGGDTFPPTATFSITNGSINVAVNAVPRIVFNEAVQLIGGTSLTPAILDTIVELRLTDVNGALVAKTATMSGDTIVVTPTALLQNSQNYWLGIRDGFITDLAGNALGTGVNASFSTISLQTTFVAGDIAPIAYRMNATATEDEVALLTFVNILPGTILNFTDSKYVPTNAQPQCTGGIQWTAPAGGVAAGTVIYVQNDIPAASLGTITGGGFGLSSGGDQFIVYTGTAATASHVTALTSNGWLATNSSCSGSISAQPAGLIDGVNSFNASTVAGNVSGNTVNAYYNGPQSGAFLKDSILNPAYWVGVGSGTAPQQWPNYSFPGPPTVSAVFVTGSNTMDVVFTKDMNQASATTLANYTGITGLGTAVMTNNGALNDTVTLTFSTPFASGNSYTISVANVVDQFGDAMFAPFSFTFTYSTIISFAQRFMVIDENAGQANIVLNVENPSAASFDVSLWATPYSTAGSVDYTFTNQTITLSGSSTSHVISIPIINDNLVEDDEYVFIQIGNPQGATIDGEDFFTLYIRDNDRQAPQATEEITLSLLSSFDPSTTGSTCEVVAFDAPSKRLYVTNGEDNRFDIIDFNNPASPFTISNIDISAYGSITSIAVYNGLVATSIPSVNEQDPGKVVFFNVDGQYITDVTVGSQPDMITFTPNGQKVVVCGEGQPNTTFSNDPEGTVAIIDVSGTSITQSNVTVLDFTSFNAQEASLIASGIRKASTINTLSQNLEPEYVTISADGNTAWVTLQENNALAVVNLTNNTITSLIPLGTRDQSLVGNGFDASDNNGEILISQWPVKAFFIPDAIANFTVGGVTYLITANEGDEREYSAVNERTSVGSSSTVLDSATFPHARFLKEASNLGRFRISNLSGDTDGDGDYDELNCVGSRSFTIWNAQTGAIVFDSGNDLELITAADPVFGALFNADHEDNVLKGRSRAKGPEPEGVTVGTIGANTYAFVVLERIGGVMVYKVTNPSQPEFVQYVNTRNPNAWGGDLGAETVIFIPAATSPNGKNLVVVANEISGTLAIFEVNVDDSSVMENELSKDELQVMPNPSSGKVRFAQVQNHIRVVNMQGVVVIERPNAQELDLTELANGIYIVINERGQHARLVKQ